MKTISIALALLAAASCGRAPLAEDPAPAAAPAAVAVATVAMQPLAHVVEAGGSVAAATSATLASRIAATVTAVRVRAGDQVRAGDLLVQLDDRDLSAARLRAQEAVTAAARAREAAAAEHDAAMADLAFARTTDERISGLFTREAATAQEHDQAAAAVRAAEARAAAADARVAQFAADVAAARHALTASDVNTSFAGVRAPFAGVIVERLVDPGDLAAPGLPLLRLDAAGGFRLDVIVDAARLTGVAPGVAVDVAVDGIGDRLPARVAEVARRGDDSHAFLIRLTLPAHSGLRSGLFGRARLTTGTTEALVIPRAALVMRGQLATVWAVADGRARMRGIALGERASADALEVVGGLALGDVVIVSPPPSLRDGDRVAPRQGGS